MPSYDWKGPPRYLNKRYRSPRRVEPTPTIGLRAEGWGGREEKEESIAQWGRVDTRTLGKQLVTFALRATAANIRPYKVFYLVYNQENVCIP